jgi:manganese transport protein
VIALILLTARKKIMGELVNARWLTVLGACAGLAILGLNAVLLWATLRPS